MGDGVEPLKGDTQALIDYMSLDPIVLPGEGNENLVATHRGIVDLRPFRDDPQRTAAIRRVQTTASFVELTGALASDQSMAFFDRENGHFETVIDFAWEEKPKHEQHRIEYTPRLHPEWAAWAIANGKPFEQTLFADFVEEHLDAIVSPAGADLLDLVLDIKGHKNVTFRSAKRMQDGNTQIAYDEAQGVTGSGKGELVIPNEITVRTPIHYGEDAVELPAFLRYRITNEGELLLTVKFKHVDDVVPDSLDRIAKRVEDGISVPLFTGWHTI